jgi:hypothetical protein
MEAGFQFNSKRQICDCDRLYDQFITAQESDNCDSLPSMKYYLKEFIGKCQKNSYNDFIKTTSSSSNSTGNFSGKLKEMEEFMGKMNEKCKGKEELVIETVLVNGQNWAITDINQKMRNILFREIKFVTSEEEWITECASKPLCCYYDFKSNDNGSLYFNSLALELIKKNQKLKEMGFSIPQFDEWRKLVDYFDRNPSLQNQHFNTGVIKSGSLNFNDGGFYDEIWEDNEENRLFMFWREDGNFIQMQLNYGELSLSDEVFSPGDNAAYMIRLIKK